MTDTCTAPGCIAIRDPAARREWEEAGYCAKHRQQARQRADVCLNCAAPLVYVAEVNQLTGRQLRRDGELVAVAVCEAECGYTRRARARGRNLRGQPA